MPKTKTLAEVEERLYSPGQWAEGVALARRVHPDYRVEAVAIAYERLAELTRQAAR